MKKYYVYELYNSLGTIEYVGETSRPLERFQNHIRHKPNPNNGIGKFYGRMDITMNIVKEFDNKTEAYRFQCQLQKEYGFITDSEKLKGTESDATKLKKSLAKIGKPRPQWVKDKIRLTMLSKA